MTLDAMAHDAGQVGFTIFDGGGAKSWALHGDGSFVLVFHAGDGLPGLGEDPEGDFTIGIYFEIPDQAQAWAMVDVKGFRKALLYGRQVLTVRSTGASMWECRRVLFATPGCTEERDEGIDTRDSLINDMVNWRAQERLEPQSVDLLLGDLANGGFALLTTPGLTKEQAGWLKRFIARWEMVAAEGRA